MQRLNTSPIAALGIALGIALLTGVACGGAGAPEEPAGSGDTGTGSSGASTAAATTGTASGGGTAAQPQATRVPPTPRPTIASDATPTPLASSVADRGR